MIYDKCLKKWNPNYYILSLQLLRLIEPGEKLINDKKYIEGVSYFTKLIGKLFNWLIKYDYYYNF